MDEEQDYRGKKRVINVKLEYTRKQLKQAIEDGNEEKIHKLESNIKQYEKEIKEIRERSLIYGKKEEG